MASSACPGDVIYQPMDRGTASGVLLPLATIVATDPDAVVVITPSDHGVEDPEAFRRGIRLAAARVTARRSDIVLFGVEAGAPSTDLGWITAHAPEPLGSEHFRRVRAFVEKPGPVEARRLFAAGAVWNTMVLVARASALFDVFQALLPFHSDVVRTAQGFSPAYRDAFLRDWYPELPVADFSRDVLARAANLCLYTWPATMGWSDLGTPERLNRWLALVRVA
mgnify:CR=1 FL=1